MPKSELLQMDPDSPEFVAWLKRKGFRKPRATVLHNTWSPTATQYKGLPTIRGSERFHMESRGFSTIAGNGYACPDETVFTGRNLSYDNWAHALISRHDVEVEAKRAAGGDPQFFNTWAYGLETVANFDTESPTKGPSGRSFETAMRVLTVVHRTFGIAPGMLFFHRDVADKTCPGLKLRRSDVRQELAERLGIIRLWPVVKVGGVAVDCTPIMTVGDKLTVAGTPVLAAMGVTAPNIAIHANGRAFLRELVDNCPGWSIEWDAATETAHVVKA
jgi:hypothetical protein